MDWQAVFDKMSKPAFVVRPPFSRLTPPPFALTLLLSASNSSTAGSSLMHVSCGTSALRSRSLVRAGLRSRAPLTLLSTLIRALRDQSPT